MSKYHENELYRVCPISPEKLEYPVKIQLTSEHDKTRFMNINAAQFRAIERILEGEKNMKTINTYSFDELSEDAQAKACEEYRSKGFEYAWYDEDLKSVQAFCDLFRVKVTDWSIGTYGHSYIKTDVENAHFRGWNKAKVNAIPDFLTGYCLDCAFIETFKRHFKKTGDALYSFNAAIDAGLSDWIEDMEYQESDEYIADFLTANEYQFLENGKMV